MSEKFAIFRVHMVVWPYLIAQHMSFIVFFSGCRYEVGMIILLGTGFYLVHLADGSFRCSCGFNSLAGPTKTIHFLGFYKFEFIRYE